MLLTHDETGTALQDIIARYLCCRVRYFHTTVVENKVRLLFVAFNHASLSLNILNSSSSEDSILLVHVTVMLIFSQYVN